MEIQLENLKNKNWEGMTFGDLFKKEIVPRNKEIIKKLKKETGNTILTKEFVDGLSEEDKEVLQIVQFFKSLINNQ